MPLNHGIVIRNRSRINAFLLKQLNESVNEPTTQILTQTQSHLQRIRVSLAVVLLWLLLVTWCLFSFKHVSIAKGLFPLNGTLFVITSHKVIDRFLFWCVDKICLRAQTFWHLNLRRKYPTIFQIAHCCLTFCVKCYETAGSTDTVW